jgi:ribose transport system substrate-binding protein
MLKRGRIPVACLALACVAAAIAGCGSSSSSSSSSGSSSGGESKKLTVGYLAFSLTTTPQQEMKKGQEEEGAKYGYTVKAVDGGGEPAKANTGIQTLVTQKVNAIVVDSYGPEDIKAGILAAKAAKIPVYIPYAPGPSNEVAWTVRGNAGTVETEALVKNMGESGSVLAFTLPAGANCVSSQKQFEAVMKKHPGIKVREQPIKAPGYQQEAATTTQGWLKSHPAGGEKLAIWGCWDGPATAAAAALNEAGRSDVDAYGQNTEAATVALLKKKLYTASWYFDSIAFGRHMIDLIHEQAGTPYDQIKPQFGTFPGIEVNQSNVDEFVKKYPQVLGG